MTTMRNAIRWFFGVETLPSENSETDPRSTTGDRMYDVNMPQIEEAIAELRSTLGDALLSLDIWEQSMGLPIASHNSNPVAAALFNQMGQDIVEVLENSGLMEFDSHFIMELEDYRIGVATRFSDRLAGALLIDGRQANMGLLAGIAMPRLLEQVRSAESNQS